MEGNVQFDTFFAVNTNNSVYCVLVTEDQSKINNYLWSIELWIYVRILSSLIKWKFDIVLHAYIHQIAGCANESSESTRNTGDKNFLVERYIIGIGTPHILLWNLCEINFNYLICWFDFRTV